MPIYEYKCDKCGGTIAISSADPRTNLIHISDEAQGKCGGTLKRIFSVFSFIMR